MLLSKTSKHSAIMPSEYTDEIENSSMYSEGIFLWGENLNTPQKQSY